MVSMARTDAPCRWRHASALLALAVVTVALTWLLPPLGTLWARAQAVAPSTWAAAALGLLASHALRGLRIADEWSARIGMRWTEGMRLSLLHSAAVQLLPMRSGEAGYPVFLRRHHGVPWGESAASLLRLRMQDAFLVGGLAFIALVPLGSAMARTLVAAGVLLLVASACRLAGPRLRAMRWGLLLAGRRPLGWRSWVCAGANWLLKTLTYALLVAHLAGLRPWAAWVGAVGGEIGAALPLTPVAGFGMYEAGVWAGAHSAGAGVLAADVLGAALTGHVFGLVLVLLASAAAEVIARRRWPPWA